jgi:tetratricopeptide (TPR) repeat protein
MGGLKADDAFPISRSPCLRISVLILVFSVPFAFSLFRAFAFSIRRSLTRYAAWAVLLALAAGKASAAATADSVVSVIGWNSLAMWSGSGFVVGDGRWVVTCFHVAARKLPNDRALLPARLLVTSPWSGDTVEARIEGTNPAADLALLRLPGPPLPALPLAPESALDRETLQGRPPLRVRLSGFPHLETVSDPGVPVRVQTAETGAVAVVMREQFPSLILAPTPGPQKGWSGGPATRVEDGAVVGVFFAMVSRDTAPDLWFPHATPIPPLWELLREARVRAPVLLRPAASLVSPPANADQQFQHRMHALIGAMDDRWDRMESEARALLKLTDDAGAHSLLATALAERGDLTAALRSWDAALARVPERGSLHLGRGDALLALGQTDDAIAAYRRAAQLMPDDAEAPFRLAAALERARRRLDAHRALQRAVSLAPNHPLIRWAMAESWSRYGNRADALKEMRDAVELTDDLPLGEEFRLGYAAELERARRTDEAERELRELLRRTPDSPTALMALATLLARHNRTDEARSLAQRVLDARPAPPLERAARRLLERLEQKEPPPPGASSALPERLMVDG